MKKFILSILMTAIIASAAFSQNGVIRELMGDVELKHAGAAAFVSASAGDTITPNTIVSTGFRSTATVTVGSSVITIRPLTRLSFAEIQTVENSENVNVNLQAGRVRVEVKPPAGTRTTLSVTSPSATASVRGTEFDMDTRNIKGRNGKVIKRGSSGPGVIVTGGNTSSQNKNGTSSNPAEEAESSTRLPPPVGTPSSEVLTTSSDNFGDVDVLFRLSWE